MIFLVFYIVPLYSKLCCKWRAVNDHIDGHYELHLLIFKRRNESSYYEAYKRLLTPHVSCIPSKRKILSSSHSLFLFLSLSQHFFPLISFSPLYIYIIKVIHSHLYSYLSHVYSHFTTNLTFYPSNLLTNDSSPHSWTLQNLSHVFVKFIWKYVYFLKFNVSPTLIFFIISTIILSFSHSNTFADNVLIMIHDVMVN